MRSQLSMTSSLCGWCALNEDGPCGLPPSARRSPPSRHPYPKKCLGSETDLDDITVRQLRNRRSQKINMSLAVRTYTRTCRISKLMFIFSRLIHMNCIYEVRLRHGQSRPLVRLAMLHLLWRQHVVVDMTRPLSAPLRDPSSRCDFRVCH